MYGDEEGPRGGDESSGVAILRSAPQGRMALYLVGPSNKQDLPSRYHPIIRTTMKLKIKLTRSNATKQVTFTTSRSGNGVLTGTCVGATDYQLKLSNGSSVDVSELAVGLTVNLVVTHSSVEGATRSVASAYSKYGDGSPFITMVIECRTKKPTAEGNIIIMEEDVISINYETYESDSTIMNEDELNALFKKGAGAPLMGGSRAASEASAPEVGAPINRKVTLF